MKESATLTLAKADILEVPMLIDGRWRNAVRYSDIVDPYRKKIVGRAPESTLADLDDAITAAVAAKSVIAGMPGYGRAALLRRVGVLLTERADTMPKS